MYRGGSRKQRKEQFVGEVVEKMKLLAAFEQYAANNLLQGESSKQYKTAYMAVFETGQHRLCGAYSTVSLAMLDPQGSIPPLLRGSKLESRSLEWRNSSEAMGLLPHRLREFLLGSRVGFGRLYTITALPSLDRVGDVIRLHTSAVLAGDVPWDPSSTRIQTVRAIADFYQKPFYDCVAVKVTKSGVRARKPVTTVEYAQLLCLFQAELEDEESGMMQWEPLAYVRWFNKSGVPDVLSEFKAVPLVWDKVTDPATNTYRCRESIVPLSTLIRRVYIVQDFSCPAESDSDSDSESSQQQHPMDAFLMYKRFHLSPFKW